MTRRQARDSRGRYDTPGLSDDDVQALARQAHLAPRLSTAFDRAQQGRWKRRRVPKVVRGRQFGLDL